MEIYSSYTPIAYPTTQFYDMWKAAGTIREGFVY